MASTPECTTEDAKGTRITKKKANNKSSNEIDVFLSEEGLKANRNKSSNEIAVLAEREIETGRASSNDAA